MIPQRQIAYVLSGSDGFSVVMHPPSDPDRFIVLHRSSTPQDAEFYCDAFNVIADATFREMAGELLRGEFEDFMKRHRLNEDDEL
jgi:hypothetical protein